MRRNVGWLDRVARIVLGVLLLGLYGALDAPWRYLSLIGLVPLGTGLLGHCPLYSLLGISTAKGGSP